MNIKYPMAIPFFPPEEVEAVLKLYRPILAGEGVLSLGPSVKAFEKAFAEYSGVSYAVATSSCSAALEIAFRIIGLKSGDEVIVPAETFIATGMTAVREGGRVVFAEIDPETFCLTAAEVEKRITSKTKAVVVVHMAGLITPDIQNIQSLCRAKKIALIEDAAHAPGASYQGVKAGAFGDLACFSFYPTKVMTTGEGGMLLTNNEEFFKKAVGLRNRGQDTTSPVELYADLGTNNRMTEFAAILGLSQLKHLDRFIEARNRIASIYTQALSDQPKARPLSVPSGSRHSYWRYLVRLTEDVDRRQVQARLKEEGIASDWAYDPPLHLQPFFKTLYGTYEGALPVTENILKHFISLPIHAQLTDQDAQTITAAFKKALNS